MSFDSDGYQNLNRIRLEHLDSLQLDIEDAEVLELGAGVGDLTSYWVQKGCMVTCVEGREENANHIKDRYRLGMVTTMVLDLDDVPPFPKAYDIVFSYGILYHLRQPFTALKSWAMVCRELLLLETVISKTNMSTPVDEDPTDPTAGINKCAIWPNYDELVCYIKDLFPCVYAPARPPDHEEYTTSPQEAKGLVRRVLVASRSSIDYNSNLVRL